MSSRYFDTIQASVIAGRVFTEADRANSQPVAVVTEKFVERFFPKGDALGKQIRIDTSDASATQWRQIVGIVHDVKSWPLNLTEIQKFTNLFRSIRPQKCLSWCVVQAAKFACAGLARSGLVPRQRSAHRQRHQHA